MAMVPRRAILQGAELIRIAVTRCDRTFSYSSDTVVLIGVQLSNTMPMNRGTVPLEIILDGNLCTCLAQLGNTLPSVTYRPSHPNKSLLLIVSGLRIHRRSGTNLSKDQDMCH